LLMTVFVAVLHTSRGIPGRYVETGHDQYMSYLFHFDIDRHFATPRYITSIPPRIRPLLRKRTVNQQVPTNQTTNQPTNQKVMKDDRKGYARGGRPVICSAFLRTIRMTGGSPCNYNGDCAYTNDFPLLAEGPYVVMRIN
jgi:hypothetical protein